MKINIVKIENWSRITAGVILYEMSFLAIIGVLKGNYGHIVSALGFALMATAILRKW